MKIFAAPLIAAIPCLAAAQGITVRDPVIPVAPPRVMAHAAYMTLENTGDQTRSLIGIGAPGYAMAHLHQSEDLNGIATMTPLHQLDIEAGQSVTLAAGGLHVMLMRPSRALSEGDAVMLELEFANGARLPVKAVVVARKNLPTGHGS